MLMKYGLSRQSGLDIRERPPLFGGRGFAAKGGGGGTPHYEFKGGAFILTAYCRVAKGSRAPGARGVNGKDPSLSPVPTFRPSWAPRIAPGRRMKDDGWIRTPRSRIDLREISIQENLSFDRPIANCPEGRDFVCPPPAVRKGLGVLQRDVSSPTRRATVKACGPATSIDLFMGREVSNKKRLFGTYPYASHEALGRYGRAGHCAMCKLRHRRTGRVRTRAEGPILSKALPCPLERVEISRCS